jgi:tRNA threonylcarbamoyladenosine biosynthesis protein TsaB
LLTLALETATEVAGVALLDGPRVLGEESSGGARHHAASVLVAVDRVLSAAGRGLDAVEAIALSIGPGSFTGLRVGLATALGLCFGTERSIVPVPTLAALSLHGGHAERIAPMLDARKGQVYAGLYAPDARSLRNDRVAYPLDWLEGLEGEGPVLLLGSGARLYANEISSVLGSAARFLPEFLASPRAASVGFLADRIAADGGALPPERVRLQYHRASDAELHASRNSSLDTPRRNP